MDKKSLDIIVEEFFDTGKVSLNEIHAAPWYKAVERSISKTSLDLFTRNTKGIDLVNGYIDMVGNFITLPKQGRKNIDQQYWWTPSKYIEKIYEFFLYNPKYRKEIAEKLKNIKDKFPNLTQQTPLKHINDIILLDKIDDKTNESKKIYKGIGNVDKSTAKYETVNELNKEILNLYDQLDDDFKPRDYKDIKTKIEGWIQNNDQYIWSINRETSFSNFSEAFKIKIQELNPDTPIGEFNKIFKNFNPQNEVEVESLVKKDWEKFKDLLIKQIREDGSYRYGKWVAGEVEDDVFKNLTRIEKFSKPKGEKQIETIFPLSDVVESVMKVIVSEEGRIIIARSILIQRDNIKLTAQGGIMKKLVDAELINLGQLRLMKQKTTLNIVKNKFNEIRDKYEKSNLNTPFKFLEWLGFKELDILPIQFVSTKKPSEATEYEESFGNICDDIKYFQVTKGEGNTSRISKTKSYNKSLLGLVGDSNMSVNYITGVTYNEIITNETLKYDIKTLEPVTLNSLNTDQNFTLNVDDPIEVKKSSYEKGFHLIEFYGAFKNIKKPVVDEYEHMDKFTEVLEGLRKKLQSELESESGKGWEIIKSINDVTKGVFFEDYIFLPKDSYTLRWSLEGARNREPRLTIRVDYIPNAPVYYWKEGNPNCGEKFKYPNCETDSGCVSDNLEESITNFFDTGNFEF
tara:strand:- start:1389 stop:3443 length:2055 start_codon:yes stop_codon:yes gene_type:complete